jgi:pyridoxal phosphate enzyme (YggS family)
MIDDLVSEIKINYEQVKDKIINAANRSGRNPDSIRLIVVTKSQPLEVVKAAVEAGASILGENYAEEGLDKILALHAESGVEWHMIGHVQSRKAALVANHFNYLHSLDGLKLAKRLDSVLGESDKKLPVLLEFNVGGEESKYGWQAIDEKNWEKFLPEIEQILDLPHLRVEGLMTMPPYYQVSELIRPFFSKLRKLRGYLTDKFPNTNWNELSMGTSSDYEIAVEEGATFIRVGRAILGTRPTKRLN